MGKKSKAKEEKLSLNMANLQWYNTMSAMSNFNSSDGTPVNFSLPSEQTQFDSLLAMAITPPSEQELTPFSPYINNTESPYTLGLTSSQLQDWLREKCCQVLEGIKLGREYNIIVQLSKGIYLSKGYKGSLGDTVIKIVPIGADKPTYYYIKAGDTLDAAIFLYDDLVTGIMLIRDDKGKEYYLRLAEFHLLTLRNSPTLKGELALMTSFIRAGARNCSGIVSGPTLDPIKLLFLSDWFKASWQQAKDAATESSNNAIGGESNG